MTNPRTRQEQLEELEIHSVDLARAAAISLAEGRLDYAAIDLQSLKAELSRTHGADTLEIVVRLQLELNEARQKIGLVRMGVDAVLEDLKQ